MMCSDITTFDLNKMEELTISLISASCWDEYRNIVNDNKSVLFTDYALDWLCKAKSRLRAAQDKNSNDCVYSGLSLLVEFICISRECGTSSALLKLQHRKRSFAVLKNVTDESVRINKTRDFLLSMFGKDRSEMEKLLQNNIEYVRSHEFAINCQKFLENAPCIESKEGMPAYTRLVEALLTLNNQLRTAES